MNNLPQVERIKIKIRLAKHTDYFLEVFGSNSHKYILGSPIDIKEIFDFESKINTSLPNGYKQFLLEVGNGGLNYHSIVGNSAVGPGYGIFKLGHDYHDMIEISTRYLEKEPFFTEHTTKEEWDTLFENVDEDISDEDYEHFLGSMYAGILNIGYSGCSSYFGILLSGKNKGRVVLVDYDFDSCPQFVKETTFLDWYESWLNQIISGKIIRERHPRYSQEMESDIVIKFITDLDDEYWRFRNLNHLRAFKVISSNSRSRLWQAYQLAKDPDEKICLLNFLTRFDYKHSNDEISKLSKENPMAFLRNIHLYAKDKTHEWKYEIQCIKEDYTLNSELTEYVKYVTEVDFNS